MGMFGMALGLGGGLLGGLFNRPKRNPYQDALMQSQAKGQAMGQGAFNQLMPGAQRLMTQGQESMTPATNYWAGILGGNRASIMETMQPQISNISQGYNTARQTAAQVMPRTGPGAAAQSALSDQERLEITTALNQARPQAAQNLFSAGATQQQLGTGQAGAAIGGLSAGTAAGGSALDQIARQRHLDLMKRQQNMELGGGIGKGLFSLLQKYGGRGLLDQILSMGKKKTPGVAAGTGTEG